MPGDRLTASFGALCSALSVPRLARLTVGVLLVIHTGLLAYSAYVHSPTLNEPGHLVAGLSNWEFGRFDVYKVNPPLVKMVAALPVMAVGYNEDWSDFYEGPGARPESGMGEDFVAANGERSLVLFMIARLACIPFSWVGAITCYLWASDLYGRPSGVLAVAIWCFEPNILAHASLMTPDASATALGLAACYTFWRWLKQPTWSQAALTGIVLGLAELAKTTLILFYPLWPLMWLVYRWPDRRGMVGRDWSREAGMLVLRMVIGLYVLNLGYGFEGSFTQLENIHFVSDLFTGNELGGRGQEAGKQRSPDGVSQLAPSASSSNRFANSWLGKLPVPLPKNYLLGVDIQQWDFEHYARPSYLRGVWQDHGWWYYYIYACAIKVPLGLWVLGVFTLVARVIGIFSYPYGVGRGEERKVVWLTANSQRLTASFRDEFILLFPAFVVFAVVSAKTGFNEHMRYVLPTFPFLFVWVSGILVTKKPEGAYMGGLYIPGGCRMLPWAASLAIICWVWTSSLWIYPHSLAYFNESIGGPLNGSEHLLGSNLDWGQDLRYFLWGESDELGSKNICLAYFGLISPTDCCPEISKVIVSDPNDCQSCHCRSAKGVQEADRELALPERIPYALSVNLLHGYPWPARFGAGQFGEVHNWPLDELAEHKPLRQYGYTICMYVCAQKRTIVTD